MEFTGRIIAVLEARKGVARSTGNAWMTQEYVIEETAGQYPKKMCFEVFGEDKIREFALAVNKEVTVSFDINAREYQGRWYNTIRVWKVEYAPHAQAAPKPQFTPEQQQKVNELKNAFEAEETDANGKPLPF